MVTVQPMRGLDIMSRQEARVAAHSPVDLAGFSLQNLMFCRHA